MQHTGSQTTAVQPSSHSEWYVLIGKQWYQLPELIPTSSNSGLCGSIQKRRNLEERSAGIQPMSQKARFLVMVCWITLKHVVCLPKLWNLGGSCTGHLYLLVPNLAFETTPSSVVYIYMSDFTLSIYCGKNPHIWPFLMSTLCLPSSTG